MQIELKEESWNQDPSKRNLKPVSTSMLRQFGLKLEDGDDILIINNRFDGCTEYPIEIDAAEVVRPMIMGNNWEGCTNDPDVAAATNPRITGNIDKSGDWYASSDGDLTVTSFLL